MRGNLSKLPDIPMPASVANETKDMFYWIRLYWNNGRYQSTKYTVAPTASVSGQTGEMRLVVEGNDVRLYVHDGTNWYKSAAMTKIT